MEFYSFNSLIGRLEAALAWLPLWAVQLTVLALAIIVALTAHALIMRLINRAFGARHPFIATLIMHARGPIRLALVIFAIDVAIQSATLDSGAAAVVGQALRVALICLLGWVAHVAIEIASDLYLRRFRIDVEDNLLARKHVTQVRILRRAADVLVVLITVAAALMTFPAVRQYGVSLFASAGAAGLIVGLAARPVLSNIIAGIQIAMTQPIRIDDAVIVENEWGWVEEITGTYVVIRLWDWRRLVVPLNYFIEKPFQNWTREGAALIGSVFLYVDYTVPVERVREKLKEFASQSKLWDGQVVNLQVTDANERALVLRALVSAKNAPAAWDLRCEIREKLIGFLQEEYPLALPRARHEIVGGEVTTLAPFGSEAAANSQPEVRGRG
jgi:small-conductance mechanosensitive channel